MDTKTAVTRRSRGRPSSYNADVALKLCELIGDDMSIRKACQRPGMPSSATVYRWLHDHLEFRVPFQCALLAKFEEKGEELIRIADTKVDGKPDLKLQIKTRKWLMAKALPRKYGKNGRVTASAP